MRLTLSVRKKLGRLPQERIAAGQIQQRMHEPAVAQIDFGRPIAFFPGLE